MMMPRRGSSLLRRGMATSSSTPPATLVTIPFSHYSELARWSLDATGVAYIERASMPGFHIATVISATGRWKPATRARAGSPWAVPLLVLPDGEVVRDSHNIATHAAAGTSLYPSEHRESIHADLLHFHDRIGPIARRFAYHHLFSALDAAGFCELAAANGAPAWQVALLGSEAVFQRARGYISRGLGVSKERAARAEQYIEAELEAVSARLQQRAPAAEASAGAYAQGLHGNDVTLSDLSFASLVAPALGVSYGSPLDGVVRFPPPEALGAEYAEKAARWRATPAGAFAVELLGRRDAIVAAREAA